MLSRLSEDLSMSFLGEKLKPSKSAKDLGVVLDPLLTYDHHITSIVSSCFSILSQINRVKKSFDKETLQLLIESVVFSKMLYVLFFRLVKHYSAEYHQNTVDSKLYMQDHHELKEIRPCDTIVTSSELAPCSRTITI